MKALTIFTAVLSVIGLVTAVLLLFGIPFSSLIPAVLAIGIGVSS